MQNAAVLALLGACCGTVAAASPPIPVETPSASAPTDTVFRCDIDGRTLYTDRPCPGARSSEPIALSGIEPAVHRARPDGGHGALALRDQGLSASGALRARAYGMDSRGVRFGPGANPECPHLAQRMARVEAAERVASSETRSRIEERLSIQRSRYRELGC